MVIYLVTYALCVSLSHHIVWAAFLLVHIGAINAFALFSFEFPFCKELSYSATWRPMHAVNLARVAMPPTNPYVYGELDSESNSSWRRSAGDCY